MKMLAFSVWAALLAAQTGLAGAARADFVLEADWAGRTVFTARMAEGDDWCLHWNHSVAGFLVRDCYRVVGGHMMLERSHQPDFAAGLGHIPGRGEMTSAPEGGYWIENIDEFIANDCLRLRVGAAPVDHRIAIGGTEHSLSAIAPRQPMTITLRPEGMEEGSRC